VRFDVLRGEKDKDTELGVGDLQKVGSPAVID